MLGDLNTDIREVYSRYIAITCAAICCEIVVYHLVSALLYRNFIV